MEDTTVVDGVEATTVAEVVTRSTLPMVASLVEEVTQHQTLATSNRPTTVALLRVATTFSKTMAWVAAEVEVA